jgi:PAS domain S-box-containing protein
MMTGSVTSPNSTGDASLNHPVYERACRQQAALMELGRGNVLSAQDLESTLRELTRLVAETLDVERVSVWLFTADRSSLVLRDLYERTPARHSAGLALPVSAYPQYFRALERRDVIAADDARHDPSTREFSEGYLKPLGISSMMDAPIYMRGNLEGVLCHEHVGPARRWLPDERTFAVAMANTAAVAIAQWERGCAEEARHASDLRYRLAARATNDVIGDWNIVTGDLTWGEDLEETLGYPMGQVDGTLGWWEKRIHADDQAQVGRSLGAALDGIANEWSGEYRMLKADGSYAYIFDRGTLLRDAAGRAIRMIGAMQDLTARKQAETILKASEERFRSLARCAPVGIYLTDAEGRCGYVNERWLQFAGVASPEQAYGTGWVKALHPDDRERVSREWDACIRQGKEFRSEYRFIKPSGEITWLSGNAVALQQDGVCTGYLGSLTDISDWKKVERMKDEFVSVVSHELRTPLTSIKGSLGLLAGGVVRPLPAPAQNMVRIALQNCDRLASRVNDILHVDKIESGKLTLHMSKVDLVPVVAAAIETGRPFADVCGVTIAWHPNGTSAPVLGGPDRIVQVFTNLLSNASKFSPRGSTVLVTLERTAGRVRASIADRGQGVPKEFEGKLFQKFAQAQMQTSRSHPGTGLGLAISKALVELMHGRIGYRTEPGQGSTFFFELPE